MNRVFISKGSIEMMIHNSDSMTEFLIKLYCAVITVDWDTIKTFNDYPRVNNATATWILSKAAEKYDQGTVSMVWLNKGFSSNHEDLEDFYIGIPDNLYTLKPLYDKSDRGIEEYFNESDYDEQKRIQKDL